MDFDRDPRLPEKDTQGREVKEGDTQDASRFGIDYGPITDDFSNALIFRQMYNGQPVGGRRCA